MEIGPCEGWEATDVEVEDLEVAVEVAADDELSCRRCFCWGLVMSVLSERHIGVGDVGLGRRPDCRDALEIGRELKPFRWLEDERY